LTRFSRPAPAGAVADVRIARMRELLPERCALQVDGGVGVSTARVCVDSGANLLVAGSAIFGQSDAGEAYRALLIAALAASPRPTLRASARSSL
jgi:pentose-5-phosphate-3-epimerase